MFFLNERRWIDDLMNDCILMGFSWTNLKSMAVVSNLLLWNQYCGFNYRYFDQPGSVESIVMSWHLKNVQNYGEMMQSDPTDPMLETKESKRCLKKNAKHFEIFLKIQKSSRRHLYAMWHVCNVQLHRKMQRTCHDERQFLFFLSRPTLYHKSYGYISRRDFNFLKGNLCVTLFLHFKEIHGKNAEGALCAISSFGNT